MADEDPSDPSSNPRSRPPSSQPSAASRPRRRPGRGEVGCHGVPVSSLCHQGPSTRCFSIRPTGVVRTPEGSAAALCAWASGCKKWNSWPTPTYDTHECTVDKLDPMLKNLNNKTSCHTHISDRSSCRKQARKLQLATLRVKMVSCLSTSYQIRALSLSLSLKWLPLRQRLNQLSGWKRSKQFRHGGWPEWSSASWASLESCTDSTTETSIQCICPTYFDGDSWNSMSKPTSQLVLPQSGNILIQQDGPPFSLPSATVSPCKTTRTVLFCIVSGGGDSTRIPFWIHFDGLTSAREANGVTPLRPLASWVAKRTKSTRLLGCHNLSQPKTPRHTKKRDNKLASDTV